MKKALIYMPLLNEGTDVLRPVITYDMGDNIYKILGDEQGLTPEELDEDWLYPVGSCVTCKTKTEHDTNDTILVANSFALI
jgi:hypothetical protein